jgi:alcohol dehydrogenase
VLENARFLLMARKLLYMKESSFFWIQAKAMWQSSSTHYFKKGWYRMAVQEQVYGFFIPSVTLIGIGAHKEIPAKIKALGGSKPLVVTDKGITGAGITKQVTDLLDEASMEYVVYDDTIPNPTDENVADGVKIYESNKCDSLITLGGGSSHDCGKGVGLVVANGGTIHDYEGVDQSTNAMPPYVAVNTTAGTASEMTRFCIITDTSRKVKMAIVDWRVTPGIALDDPLLMMGMPPALTAATGMDALTHAVEAYVSTIATPMTDSAAEKAIELIAQHLRPAVANGGDIVAREGMCFAQYLAGMAFNNASLGHVHAMAHQLGGFYDLPHGECNAILLPHVEKFNLIAKLDRFVKIAELLGENTEGLSTRDAAELALDAIKTLSSDVGIPSGLVELGKRYGKDVQDKDIEIMTGNAQKDACGFTNPRLPKDMDVAAIYKAAM